MKRREFVAKSGIAAAALSASGPMWGMNTVFDKNSDVRIGIVGTGDRGGGLAPIINEIPGMSVTACCDILPFRLESGLQKAGGKAKGYSDYRSLLDDKNVDAILVTVPFSEHAKVATDALDATKHVYCEKTLAKGYQGIQELVAKVKTSKNIFQTGHQYHSSRLYTHVVELINQGKIGKIVAFDCQWNRNGNWRRPVPDPKWERMINWRMYREYSGGLVAELCSHQLDFVNWVLKATPQKVVGIGGIDYWKDGRETFDNVQLIYSYENGVKATFTCLTGNAMDDYKIKVMGDKGTIILDYVNAWFYPEGAEEKELGEVDGVSGATVNWVKGKGIPLEVEHLDPSKQALMDFRDSIRNNTKPTSDITTGANAAVCVQMGLDAMIDERIVEWDFN
ncbi:Gfo/Idh/MocA family oxidoreductase [Muricauda sp. 2012CJ35-5]|uniref:Gfo/Idh/MocA family oxidoreductase n=1 Tax=Flagellimonas spongiicola TaxID=2942208 RepID=A0ABT0PUY6_9FLAO|nr:Gfo/Idh/MocA family oxidoreductase [Allomuricauda spongiicola]MCL6274522.1 Gfo/Idh/MocA family oxidoreductase [Allomuricauda spongiicola]